MFFNGQKLPVAASRDHNNGWAVSIFDRVGIPMELAPPVYLAEGVFRIWFAEKNDNATVLEASTQAGHIQAQNRLASQALIPRRVARTLSACAVTPPTFDNAHPPVPVCAAPGQDYGSIRQDSIVGHRRLFH